MTMSMMPAGVTAVRKKTATGRAVRPDRGVRAVVGGAPCRVAVDGRPVAFRNNRPTTGG
ncbi:hypothetical protein ABZS83_36265 [Streptomyces sp. NPDC005426]|uniref:hypothetical protein n=1 Tax=Streptomyces sp. NPDC005426 TaxID=3155344 RepID=UPI0033A49AC4